MANIYEIEWNNRNVYVLENKKLKIRVDPNSGMNINHVEYDKQIVVKFDSERYGQNKTYGIPVLYPTPNRVRNCKFTFDGNQYDAQMHGFAKDQKFKVTQTYADSSVAYIEGVMEIKKGTELFERFPFESALKIKVILKENEISYNYEVQNFDSKRLPYGLAIHPFFYKNDEDVRIQVNASAVMAMSEDNLPTGELINTDNTEYQLQLPVQADKLNLDHVYTNILRQPSARIMYKKFTIELDTTADFTHIVVFTPSEAPFLCIENQTCSTDAHNMYNKGYKDLSGLEIVPPHQGKSGEIKIKFVPQI